MIYMFEIDGNEKAAIYAAIQQQAYRGRDILNEEIRKTLAAEDHPVIVLTEEQMQTILTGLDQAIAAVTEIRGKEVLIDLWTKAKTSLMGKMKSTFRVINEGI